MVPDLFGEFVETGPVTPARMRVIDANAMALGVTELQLMESAGRALAEQALAKADAHTVALYDQWAKTKDPKKCELIDASALRALARELEPEAPESAGQVRQRRRKWRRSGSMSQGVWCQSRQGRCRLRPPRDSAACPAIRSHS